MTTRQPDMLMVFQPDWFCLGPERGYVLPFHYFALLEQIPSSVPGTHMISETGRQADKQQMTQ